jgi:hypothetical protein
MAICVPRCDICQLLGEEGGLKALCTCKVCGVLVHRECYGLRDDEEVAINFVCHACKDADEAGFPFDRMDSRSVDLFRAEILEKRPVECALCSVKRGLHAMHPLYDNHGPSGQQIVLENPTRPAWVHTLCALVISTKFGYVYGCCPDGLYQYSDSSRDDTTSSTSMEDSVIDDRPPNPRLMTAGSSDNSLHHFAYCVDNGGRINTEYTELMKEHKALKCMFCKSDDTESYRIPIQCSAGNVPKDVNSDFSATRDWKLTSEYCSDPLHVGCAAWMTADGNQRTPRRIFFFPGTGTRDENQQESEPIAEVYCSFHAHKIEKCRCSNLRARLNRNLLGIPPCSDCVDRTRSKEVCDPIDSNMKLPVSPAKNHCMKTFGRAEDETSLSYRAMYEARRNAFWVNEQDALETRTHRLKPEPVDDMDIEMDDMVSEVGSKVDEPRLQSAEMLSPKVSKDARLPVKEALPNHAMATEMDSQSKKADEPSCVKRADKIPPRNVSAKASAPERVAPPSPESTPHHEDRPVARLVTPPSVNRKTITSPMNNSMIWGPIPRKKAAVSREPKHYFDDYMHSLPAVTATKKHKGNNFVHVPTKRKNARVHSFGPAPSNNQRAPARMARGRNPVPTHMEKQDNTFYGANMLHNLNSSNKENASCRQKSCFGVPAATGRYATSTTNGCAPNAAARQNSTTTAARQPKARYGRKKTAAQILNKDEAVPPNRKAMERFEEIVAALKADLLEAHPEEQAKSVMIHHKKRWIRHLVKTHHCTMKTFDELWHLVCEEMTADGLL